MAKLNELSKAELEVMKVMWKKGKATVREIQETFSPEKSWSYTTVMTLLMRVYNKGYLKRAKVGITYLYEPRVSEKETIQKTVKEFVERVFDGAFGPLVNYLAEFKEFTLEERESLKEVVKTLDKKGERRND